MGRVHLIASIAIAASVTLAPIADALAQSAPSGGGAGGTRESKPAERGGFSFGGSITGRMNLIGPSSDPTPQSPRLPAPPPGVGQPLIPSERDAIDPGLLNGLRLPNMKPAAPMQPPQPETQPALAPAPATSPSAKQALWLTASFDEAGGVIPGGVKWRVFTDQPDINGEHALVAESTDAAPRFDLDPGGYVVHAVYGLVSKAQYVQIAREGMEANVVLPAGAVRLKAFVGPNRAPGDKVSFTLTRDESGLTRTVAERVRPDTLIRLPAGAYHVVSTYGDANSIVEVDLQIGAGKLVEAQVHHKAAQVKLRLVDGPGGADVTDTSWTILTPGGDVIRDSIGALPDLVLAEGDYTAIARHDGRMFQQAFAVKTGQDSEVEVTAQ